MDNPAFSASSEQLITNHPATVTNPDSTSDWLLVCEHASNYIPPALRQLGLTDSILSTHIAYDIGTEYMTHYLAEQLNATAIFGNYSRLIVDCNRTIISPTCIPDISDGVPIPGNQNLSLAERQQRIDCIYQPFHAVVSQVVAEKLIRNPKLKLLNVHSFTPALATEGKQRPWHIGFVHRHSSLSESIITYFQQHTDYCIGDNQPYNGITHRGYTVPAHADAQEIPSLLVEFRQDLINTPDNASHWADRLLAAIRFNT